MDRFIPREKLGKKARRELDARRRAVWPVSPATRRVESKKQYNRKRKSREGLYDGGAGFCFASQLNFKGSLFPGNVVQ